MPTFVTADIARNGLRSFFARFFKFSSRSGSSSESIFVATTICGRSGQFLVVVGKLAIDDLVVFNRIASGKRRDVDQVKDQFRSLHMSQEIDRRARLRWTLLRSAPECRQRRKS